MIFPSLVCTRREDRAMRLLKRFSVALMLSCLAATPAFAGNGVIFFHPDGTGINHWTALRYQKAGPDGQINWDKLPGMALYQGHMSDSLTGTSNGGATVHAWGVRVKMASFGKNGTEALTSASGQTLTIAQEAMKAGKAVGLLQTGHIAEPGSAVFVSSVDKRSETFVIADQVIKSGAQVIMAGGERFMLPKGTMGKFGEGEREDGRNLIEEAKTAGYTVVQTKDELMALDPAKAEKVLGIFAANHTFNDKSEEKNREANAPEYVPTAPTIAEMADFTLKVLSRDPDGFFLVAEEEGTDNFGNQNNAKGQMTALSRADDAIGVFEKFVTANPESLMVMAADSEAGGLQVLGASSLEDLSADKNLPGNDANGAPIDGAEGTGSKPFLSAADKSGVQHPFAIAWGAADDTSGNVIARAMGKGSEKITGLVDNVGIYRVMYETLFGKSLP
jgi:alkaline phosphatase